MKSCQQFETDKQPRSITNIYTFLGNFLGKWLSYDSDFFHFSWISFITYLFPFQQTALFHNVFLSSYFFLTFGNCFLFIYFIFYTYISSHIYKWDMRFWNFQAFLQNISDVGEVKMKTVFNGNRKRNLVGKSIHHDFLPYMPLRTFLFSLISHLFSHVGCRGFCLLLLFLGKLFYIPIFRNAFSILSICILLTGFEVELIQISMQHIILK